MRSVVAAVLLAACGAQLGGGGGGSDKPADALVDTPPRDAAIDARACVGGDAHMVGPNGECLVMFTTPTTYVDAKAACAAMSAHLAYLGLTDLATEGTFG